MAQSAVQCINIHMNLHTIVLEDNLASKYQSIIYKYDEYGNEHILKTTSKLTH